MYTLPVIAVVAMSLSGIPTTIPNVQVWFEAAGLNGVSGVAQQGAIGQDLRLTCDNSGSPTAYEWNVSMKMLWDTGSLVSVISSQATDFLGDTGTLRTTNFVSGDYPWSGTNYVEVNSGGFLAQTKGVMVPVAPGPIWQGPLPGIYTAFTMHLTADGLQGDPTANAIDARINNLLWTLVYNPAGPTGGGAMVQFGDAPAVPGDIANTIVEDVIMFQYIPEPALAAIVMGGLLLSRPNRKSER